MPADGATVTAPTTVLGSATDDVPSPFSWTLTAQPLAGGSATVIATGTTQLSNATLGTFDPTLLANGFYAVTLAATDSGGNTRTAVSTVLVTGNLKLGNFRTSSTDLIIPVAGIPITIARSYDTLHASEMGDFGYGWKLDLGGDVTIQVNHADPSLSNFGEYVPFHDGTRVTIIGSDGSSQAFTFQPAPIPVTLNLQLAPLFVPDPGVTNTLTVRFVPKRKRGREYFC